MRCAAGFANVTSPGRCEIIHRDPTIILDAAHNPHGAKAIAETIQSEFTFDDVTGIVALMADKDALGIFAGAGADHEPNNCYN